MILRSGPGSLPKSDLSSSDLEYPRDVDFFGVSFDKIIIPLVNERLELHRKLDDFTKTNNLSVSIYTNSDSLGQTFRTIAREILDSEKKISQVLSLRTPPTPSPSSPPSPPSPPPSPPPVVGDPGKPDAEPVAYPNIGKWSIAILGAFGLLVVLVGCFGSLTRRRAAIIVENLSW